MWFGGGVVREDTWQTSAKVREDGDRAFGWEAIAIDHGRVVGKVKDARSRISWLTRYQ